jgi:transcriptional regulator with XRE-family HTH domain
MLKYINTCHYPTIYKSEQVLYFIFQKNVATFVNPMSTNMNNRLKQFLAAENITQAQFADTLNVVRASVSHILSGRNNPSFDFIKAMMANYPSLNMDWLIFGKGKMYKDSDARSEEALLFPEVTAEPEAGGDISLPVDDLFVSEQTSIKLDTSDNTIQPSVKQRKVSKIIVLFDDGTYQEM